MPGSLSLLSSLFEGADRGRAIGAWSGLTGVFTALGPFVGGFLVMACDPGLAAGLPDQRPAVRRSRSRCRGRRSPTCPATGRAGRLDLWGAALVTAGLALVVYPLIEWQRLGSRRRARPARLPAWWPWWRSCWSRAGRAQPMLPLGLFRIRTFSVANAVTFVVYAALGGAAFLLVVTLQLGLGYSPLEAGAAGLPITIVAAAVLLQGRRAGPAAGRTRCCSPSGPWSWRWGLLLLGRIGAGSHYLTGVLPGVLVFAAGLVLVVAPVTTTVLGDVGSEHSGAASGTNNAVARIGSLIAVAVLPLTSGLATVSRGDADGIAAGFHSAMLATAGLCLLGGLLALVGLPSVVRGRMPG